jgi:hypothetical protein
MSPSPTVFTFIRRQENRRSQVQENQVQVGSQTGARNIAMRKDFRSAPRERRGTTAWIRFDNGFSVRPCRLVDLSNTGVRIMVDAPRDVAGNFSLLLTRDAAPGRRCKVKWRKGSEIGAEFAGMKATA